jgi:glycerol-3-phosphate dehydrogenase (NAD(P)+)
VGFGPGTLAVLATRGMAEATRVVLARGGSERTTAGLAGFGDLLAAIMAGLVAGTIGKEQAAAALMRRPAREE